MRSIGVALESYIVDHNNYPMPQWAGENATLVLGFLMIEPAIIRGHPVPYIGVLLTTPTAYLSSVPFSIYNTQLQQVADNYTGRKMSFWINVVKPGYHNSSMDAWIRDMRVSLLDKFPDTVHWLMESAGPNLSWWHGARGATLLTQGAIHNDIFMIRPTGPSAME